MMKHKRQAIAVKHQGQESLQHTEEIEDNLLPSVEEIEKLHSMDPAILTWLKSRAELEQTFRHSMYINKVEKIDSLNRREHNTTRYGLTIYFFLVVFCIIASYLLIKGGHSLQGTMFGGAAIILSLAVLASKTSKRDK